MMTFINQHNFKAQRFCRLWAGLAFMLMTLTPLGSLAAQSQAEPGKTEQQKLVLGLSVGDEEQRMDAAARLGSLFLTTPGVVTDSTMTALFQSLQQEKSPVIRALAARALELSGDPRAATPLLSALSKERQIAVRKAIIYALARYPSSAVTSTLIPLLKERNHENRAAAAYALAELNDPTAEKALSEVLQKRGQDQDAFARAQAARGLGRLGGREAIEILLRALTRDKYQEVRREAAHALGVIALRQDVKVIEALQSASLSSDPYLSLAADDALRKINTRT